MKIRYAVLVFLSFVSLFLGTVPNQAQAQTDQEPTGFQNVRLWVYPEYDDPRLLVMMQGKITGPTAPVKVRFLIPTAATMYSAGSMDAQNQYSGGPPDRKASDIAGWDEVSYELKTDTFRVEYYDPVIPTQPLKEFSYEFRSLYPISGLQVFVQQPGKATDFVISPTGGSATVVDGLKALAYQYPDRPKDQPLRFDLTYTKTDPNPSIKGGSTTGGTTGSNEQLVIAVVVVVAAAIIGGFIWIMKSSPKTRKAAVRAGPVAAKRRREAFCTQCGKTIEAGARFCPHCGAKQRRAD